MNNVEQESSLGTSSPANKAVIDDGALAELVNVLVVHSKDILQISCHILNVLHKKPCLMINDCKSAYDMTDLGTQLLEVPSTFFSDTFGGSGDQALNDRVTGLARLEIVCQAREKWVLRGPEYTMSDDIDSGDAVAYFEKNPLLNSTFDSKYEGNAKGDAAPYPMKKLISTRRDQLWICQLNARFIPVVTQPSEYEGVNDRPRKPYEDPIYEIIQGAFLFSEASAYRKKLNGDQAYYRCSDLPGYTALTLYELMRDFVALEQLCIQVVNSVSEGVKELCNEMFPKLKSVIGSSVSDSEIDEALKAIDSWWVDSPFLPVKEFLHSAESDSKTKSIDNRKLIFNSYWQSLFDQVDAISKKIPVIMAMHPPSDAIKVTPIHSFSAKFFTTTQVLLKHIEALRKHLNPESQADLAAGAGFITDFDILRRKYRIMYPANLTDQPKLVAHEKNNAETLQEGSGQRVLAKSTDPATLLSSQFKHSYFTQPDATRPKSPLPSPRKAGVQSANTSPRNTLSVSQSSDALSVSTTNSPVNNRGRSPRNSPRNSPREGSPLFDDSNGADATLLLSANTLSANPDRKLQPVVRQGTSTSMLRSKKADDGSLRRKSIRNNVERARSGSLPSHSKEAKGAVDLNQEDTKNNGRDISQEMVQLLKN